MQPVMNNVQAGASKGGNDLIDVDLALGYECPSRRPATTSATCPSTRSASGGRDPLDDDKDLRYVYELHGERLHGAADLRGDARAEGILKAFREGHVAPGLHYGLDRVLHGEQLHRAARPLPQKAKLSHRTCIKDIFDKGKNAFVVTAVETYDETGELLA
jgi:3-hydroxyacyl-CoA dehydrogenase/3a,7a,12a-trihydroxy-5b-cholest-24-enoyl-CoA hydratase